MQVPGEPDIGTLLQGSPLTPTMGTLRTPSPQQITLALPGAPVTQRVRSPVSPKSPSPQDALAVLKSPGTSPPPLIYVDDKGKKIPPTIMNLPVVSPGSPGQLPLVEMTTPPILQPLPPGVMSPPVSPIPQPQQVRAPGMPFPPGVIPTPTYYPEKFPIWDRQGNRLPPGTQLSPQPPLSPLSPGRQLSQDEAMQLGIVRMNEIREHFRRVEEFPITAHTVNPFRSPPLSPGPYVVPLLTIQAQAPVQQTPGGTLVPGIQVPLAGAGATQAQKALALLDGMPYLI